MCVKTCEEAADREIYAHLAECLPNHCSDGQIETCMYGPNGSGH